MTPERMAALVARWVRFYTRNVPPSIAQRRIGEIDADLHDHIAHERAQGSADRRIAFSMAGRMLRGMTADASWRRAAIARSPSRKEVMKTSSSYRSAVRVGLVTALILLVPLVATLTSDDAGWSLADFVFGAVVLAGTGAILELAARKPRSVAYRAAATAIGVAAIAFGNADDAPGLVLFGCLLILGTLALSVRTAQRHRS